MNEFTWVKLPLYQDWDYRYRVVLEGGAFMVRLYYSDRTQKWSMDLSTEDGTDVILGEAISVFKQHKIRQGFGLTGFFWLEPIAENINNTPLYPDLMYKYYNLYYILPQE